MQNAYMRQIIQEIDNDQRLPEEIYAAIITRLKIISKDKLTAQEAHTAARNLIGFCQEIINYKMTKHRNEKQTVQTSQNNNSKNMTYG